MMMDDLSSVIRFRTILRRFPEESDAPLYIGVDSGCRNVDKFRLFFIESK